jgi:hypothetical protein
MLLPEEVLCMTDEKTEDKKVIMYNPKSKVEIVCTDKFKPAWEKLGFAELTKEKENQNKNN